VIEKLYRDLLIPAFESGLKRRPVFRYWRELERSQWLTAREIDELQLEALRALLRHAAEHCGYYRETWASRGLDPRGPLSLEEFRRWPILDRATVRENRLAMRAQAPGLRLIAKATGGSSGEPLHFDLDTGSYERRMAAWHRGYGWAGAGPGTKQTYLWGAPFGEVPLWRRAKNHLYHALYRREVINSFLLSESNAVEYLRRINDRRPDVIVAYAAPLFTLARILKERGLEPHSPRTIVVGAEALQGFQRALIEEVFQAPVFETYGSREFMLLGAECDHHAGLHLTAEQILLEVVDDDGQPVPPGTEGNVVVTDLYNYGMPFVRYATGDRALAGTGPCPCGRGLPLLGRVLGRRLDVLHTPDGRRIGGEVFVYILMPESSTVRRFQVVQEAPAEIILRLVLAPGIATLPDRLAAAVKSVVGEAVQLRIEFVDDIPLTRSGKLQVVVNRLADRDRSISPVPVT
jgi:phenylacetate-CoA ligase